MKKTTFKPTKTISFTVSKRAIVARIQRAVAKDWKQFKATRSKKDRELLGPWCVMEGQNYVFAYDPERTLEDWAKHYGVLAANEQIED